MKKRKVSILQRMMAVLLAAVLVAGMVSEAAPMTARAQETGEPQESVCGNLAETVECDTETEPVEGTDSEKQEEIDSEGQEETGTEEGGSMQEPDAGTESGTSGTETEEETEPETASGNPAADEENGNLQALLARIAALPDAEEYLAAEPDADSGEADEDAYEEWLAGLYAYAEEALAIQEAVEELSEEERTEIPQESLAKLAAWAEAAEWAAESSMVMAEVAPQADNIASGEGWLLTADEKLTITSDTGMTNWKKEVDTDERLKTQVSSVVLSDGVTAIEISCFKGYVNLTDIEIPGTVKKIGDSAFYGCTSLTGIEIPQGVTSMGNFAFSGCTNLTSVKIPESVTSIGASAFSRCTNLTSVNIPEGVTSIGSRMFYECKSLENVNIPDTVTSIGENAFYWCKSLENVNIPAGVTEIGQYAFRQCTSLKSVTIPESMTEIKDYTFYNCVNLADVTIKSEKVTRIGEYAFNSCASLAEIVIPESVTEIGRLAFSGCSNLSRVVVSGEQPATLVGTGTFQNSKFYKDNVRGIFVPEGTVDAYKNAWSNWEAYITDGTHEHNWSSDWTTNETHHWHECAVSDCPTTDNAAKDGYGEHIYDNDSDITCDSCGYKRTVEITGISVGCDLTSARAAQTGDTLVMPASSITLSPDVSRDDVGSWWKKKEDNGFAEYKGNTWEEGTYVWKVTVTIYEGYVFGAELKVTSPSGEHWTVAERSDNNRIIVLCSDEIVKEAPPHVHDLTLTPAKSATCTKDGNEAYYTCSSCDKWFSDAAGTQEITDKSSVVIPMTGQHDYDVTAWGYTGADGHAHKCRNCNKYDTTSVLKHTPGAAATETTPQTCTVCGYEIMPPIEHTHNYGDWQHNDTQHWKVCACGDETDRGNHDFGDWITDQEATATEAGTKHRDCQTCGCTETGTIPATGESHTHEYGDWQHDSTQHWKVCACGDETDRGNHDFGDWITDQEATATEVGTKHRDCRTCGYMETGTIPAMGTGPESGTVTPEVKPGNNAPETSISTSAEELEDMLLTDEEKKQVQNGTNIKIVLEVQDAGSAVSDSDKEHIRQALNGYTVGQYLNIDLYKLVGANRTDITETAKKIRIVITVPDDLKNTDSSKTRVFAVTRVHDGRAELLTDLDNSADTITIETDRFSTYAVVYKDTANGGNGENEGNGNNGNDNQNNNDSNNDNNNSDNSSNQNNANNNGTKPDSVKDNEPKTGDSAPLGLYATLAMIAGFAYLLLYLRTKRGE